MFQHETRVIDFTCQKCGAQLELNLENLSLYCPYCGQKLHYDSDNLTRIALAREKTKQNQNYYEHKERLEDKHNFASYRSQIIEWLRDISPSVLRAAGMFVLVVVCVIALLVINHNASYCVMPLDAESAEGEDYDDIVDELEAAGFNNISVISSKKKKGHDVDDGEIISITLNGEDTFKKNKEYKKDVSIVIKFYTSDGLVELPISSASVKNMDYRDLKDLFESYGFTNIQTKKVSDWLNGLRWDDWDVISVTVGGEKKFTEGDRLDPDTLIIIEYFHST